MNPPVRIRVLIVDDEPLARRGIQARLASAADFEVVGEAASGREATRAIADLEPDLVFLDVQMPELDGFGVVEAVGPDRMPVTIFVTAYDQHALRAFAAHALDYLLKPIDNDRFEQALVRARRLIGERQESAFGRKLADVLADSGAMKAGSSREDSEAKGRRPIDRFFIKGGGRVRVVPVEEVDWIEAAGDYVRLHAGKDAYLLRDRISHIAELLDPARFARIHRSTIVNLDQIRELHPHVNREYLVVLKDGTTLKLSRSYRDEVESRFGGAL